MWCPKNSMPNVVPEKLLVTVRHSRGGTRGGVIDRPGPRWESSMAPGRVGITFLWGQSFGAQHENINIHIL